MARARLDVMVAVSFAVAGSLGVVSAGKPPKLQPVTATVTFRCVTDAFGSPGPCDPLGGGDGNDRVRADEQGPYSGVIDPSGLFTPLIAAPANGRVVNFHFGSSISGSRTCLSVDNCHLNGPSDGEHLALVEASLRVKPLVNGTWEDLPGLLFGMSTCNVPYPALVHYTFWLDGNGHWGFNFNPRAYPGTTPAVVMRLDDVTWTVEAESGHIGELLSWGHTRIRRNNGPSGEGRFNMPFKATIVASSPLPAGAGTCS